MESRQKYFFISYLSIGLLLILFCLLISGKHTDKGLNPVPDMVKLENRLGYLNLNDSIAYTGMASCKKCHEDIYNNYLKTGMAKSWGYATPSKSVAVFNPAKPLYDPKSNLYYQPYWDKTNMMVEEYRLEGNNKSYSRTEKVDYVVGSGQHTNSHLKSYNGYLYQVPFTFYSQSGILDMPPGFEDHNARFSRKIGFECITCHNSYPSAVMGSINKYNEIPLGINCERCHGPGGLHIKAMEAGEVVDIKKDIDYTIVNPRKLPQNLQIEVCSRCHNQGNAVLKKGKSFFDFKPGMCVSNIFDVFREKYENEEDVFWMETQPERMKRSKCFSLSQRNPDYHPMNCMSCHLPHISFKLTPNDSFNSRCANCHNIEEKSYCTESVSKRNTYKNDCIKCHMPRTGTYDIPHVVISDHHIRINDKWNQPTRDRKTIVTGKFQGIKCMSNDHPDKLTLAQAWLSYFEKFNKIPSALDSALYYLKNFSVQDYPETWMHYYYLRNDYSKLINTAEKSVKEEDFNAITCYRLGQSYSNQNNHPQALEYFQKASDLEPYNMEYRNKVGTEYLSLGETEKAIPVFEYIIRQVPNIAIAYNNLGFICLIKNDLLNAEEYLSKALALDPDYIPAHLNYVKIYLLKGNNRAAETYLLKLKKQFPFDAQINQMFALLKKQP